jgi:DNA invertase Pin-like site-specific DNA recombinase
MTMNVLAAVAPFERDLRIEHTQSGLQGHRREARSPAGAQS